MQFSSILHEKKIYDIIMNNIFSFLYMVEIPYGGEFDFNKEVFESASQTPVKKNQEQQLTSH